MSIDLAVAGSAAVSFVLAVLSVALWTVRVALTSAGRRLAGAGVAAVEALTFSIAFSRIVADLDNPLGLLAYALGVGTGTLIGLALDERFSPGQSWVRVIVEGDGVLVCEALRQRRWPVTAVAAVGPSGPVTELLIAVDDTNLRALVQDLDIVATGAFRAVERLRSSQGRPLPGMRQVRQRAAGGRRNHRSVTRAGAAR